jgi:flagellar hook-associated protein FlgK
MLFFVAFFKNYVLIDCVVRRLVMETSSVSLSGMGAASLNVQVTANNVANLRSEDFLSKRLDQADQAAGGTRPTQIVASEQPASPPGGSNVELEREMVSLIRDETAYSANAAVVQTQSQMMGTVMDLKA